MMNINDVLKLNECLNALILIAFANGTGDIILTIVSSNHQNGISGYNVG